MSIGNGTRGMFSGNRRYATVIGLLVFAALLTTIFQLSTKMQDLGCKISAIATPVTWSNIQVYWANQTCKNCFLGESAVIEDYPNFSALELNRERCLTDIRSRILEDYRPFFENVKKVALVDVALHVNLGDTILWRSAIHIATLFGHTVDYVCTSSQAIDDTLASFPRCDMNKTIRLVQDNGLVMYHAGGNWGDLYRWVQEYRIRVINRLATAYKYGNATFKVIQLPQSIFYTPSGRRSVALDDVAMNKLPSGMFTLFTREHESFLWARSHYRSNVNVRESPDIAFSLGQLTPIGKPSVDVIFIMRRDQEDAEKHKKVKAKVEALFEGTGLTYSYQGYNYQSTPKEFASGFPTVVSEVRLNAVIKTISRGKILITNRFHGHIIGMMMGRTTFWVDTVQKKLTNARNVAFRSSKYCNDQSMRSFQFPSTLEATKAAIQHLVGNRTQ